MCVGSLRARRDRCQRAWGKASGKEPCVSSGPPPAQAGRLRGGPGAVPAAPPAVAGAGGLLIRLEAFPGVRHNAGTGCRASRRFRVAAAAASALPAPAAWQFRVVGAMADSVSPDPGYALMQGRMGLAGDRAGLGWMPSQRITGCAKSAVAAGRRQGGSRTINPAGADASTALTAGHVEAGRRQRAFCVPVPRTSSGPGRCPRSDRSQGGRCGDQDER